MISIADKPLPNSQPAEESIVSSMLQEPEKFIAKAASCGLDAEMFYDPRCRYLFSKVREWDQKGLEIEQIQVWQRISDAGEGDRVGGPGGLSEVWLSMRSMGRNFEKHSEIIREKHAQRLIAIGAKEVSNLASGGESPSDALHKLSEIADEARASLTKQSAFKTAKEASVSFMKEFQERCQSLDLPGQSTGIPQIDAIAGGMRPGELWVISGKTSGGKSVLSLQMAQELIKTSKRVLVFTLEMAAEEIIARLISNIGNVPMQWLMNPSEGGKSIIKEQVEKIKRGTRWMENANLSIADKPGMTADWICGQAEMANEEESVDLVIIDYIQLVDADHVRGRSREQELAKMSRQFKQLAKRIKAPVITPSQLNDEGRLRECRAIGHDADVVLSISEDGVKVDKYRNAPRDQFLPLVLNGEVQRFVPKYAQNH